MHSHNIAAAVVVGSGRKAEMVLVQEQVEGHQPEAPLVGVEIEDRLDVEVGPLVATVEAARVSR